jgi:hypothetical protein
MFRTCEEKKIVFQVIEQQCTVQKECNHDGNEELHLCVHC